MKKAPSIQQFLNTYQPVKTLYSGFLSNFASNIQQKDNYGKENKG